MAGAAALIRHSLLGADRREVARLWSGRCEGSARGRFGIRVSGVETGFACRFYGLGPVPYGKLHED